MNLLITILLQLTTIFSLLAKLNDSFRLTTIPDLLFSLLAKLNDSFRLTTIPDLLFSLLTKLDESFPADLRSRWLNAILLRLIAIPDLIFSLLDKLHDAFPAELRSRWLNAALLRLTAMPDHIFSLLGKIEESFPAEFRSRWVTAIHDVVFSLLAKLDAAFPAELRSRWLNTIFLRLRSSPDLLFSLPGKIDEAFPAELRYRWLTAISDVVFSLLQKRERVNTIANSILTNLTQFLSSECLPTRDSLTAVLRNLYDAFPGGGAVPLVVGAVAVLILLRCFPVACWNILRGVFLLLRVTCRWVVWVTCRWVVWVTWVCGRPWVKMMKAPGTGGKLIARGAFETDPKVYFAGLRAAKR